MSRVIVVGSINQDVTVTVDRFPSPGETLSGTSLTYGLGGKGANQAAAAAHSGVPVFFVGAVGADPSGQRLRADLASHGVDVTHLREADGPSGTALITVASSGENTIILDAGANATVTVEPAKASLFPAPADVVVLQAEIPERANAEALAWAHSFGARVLLNLAPARPTDAAFMARVDILVVNETEAGLTLGMPAPASPTEAIGVEREGLALTLGGDVEGCAQLQPDIIAHGRVAQVGLPCPSAPIHHPHAARGQRHAKSGLGGVGDFQPPGHRQILTIACGVIDQRTRW